MLLKIQVHLNMLSPFHPDFVLTHPHHSHVLLNSPQQRVGSVLFTPVLCGECGVAGHHHNPHCGCGLPRQA